MSHPLRTLILTATSMLLVALVGVAQIQFGRPKAVPRLPNPSVFAFSRDDVLAVTRQMLETREIPIEKEDCNENTGECTISCKSVTFIRGVTTQSQLQHYAEVPTAFAHNWVQGRYTLRILVSPATPASSEVGVYARFEGMRTDGIGNEWVGLTSKGELEDSLLKCIQSRLLGDICEEEKRR